MKRSGSRKFARYGGLVLALATVVVAVASAQAAPGQKKLYTISITPGLAAPGSSGSYSLILTNLGGSQALGSSNITVPSGFTVTVDPSSPAGWSVSGQVVMWRAGTSSNAIQPGLSSTATLNVTVASAKTDFACSASSPWTWTSAVKQSNDFSGTGNDFTPGGPDASLTAAKLVFTGQPSQTVVSTSISPDVKVTLEDACDSPLSVAGSVGVSIANNPSGGALSGTLTRDLSSGVATFNDLKIDASGVGYTLLATPGSSLNIAPSAPSDPFNIIDKLCTHTGGSPTCTASNSVHDTTVSVPVPNGNAQTALSVGKPTKVLASCSTTVLSQVGSVATIAPQGYAPGATISVTLVYAASVATTPGTSSYLVCVLLSDGSFDPAQPCSKHAPPCVSNRSRNGTGGLVIVLTINASDPGGVTYN